MRSRTPLPILLLIVVATMAGCADADPPSDVAADRQDEDGDDLKTPTDPVDGNASRTVFETLGPFTVMFQGGNQTFTVPNGTVKIQATAYANVTSDGPYAMDNPGFTYGPNVGVRSYTRSVTEEPTLHFIFERDAGVGTAGEAVQGPMGLEETNPPFGGWDVFVMGGVGQNIEFDVTIVLERLATTE